MTLLKKVKKKNVSNEQYYIYMDNSNRSSLGNILRDKNSEVYYE